MTDVLSRRQRSFCMSRIGGKNTKPELLLRYGLFALGIRYGLHARHLPGTPDLVFPKYRAVIFVHGCFWHKHGCALFKWPKTNVYFWRQKIKKNVKRDRENEIALALAGWRVLVVWECTLKGKGIIPSEKVPIEVARWLRASSSRRI